MVTQNHIESGLQFLELSGLPVCLHASLRSFGHVEEGAEAVLRAFLAQGCTVLVPTFSDGFSIPPPHDMRPRQNGWDYEAYSGSTEGVGRVYSPQTNEITLEEMGLIPAGVLAQPGRVRGRHPLCSFAAIGADATELISGQTPMDAFAPLRTLAKAGGWVLLMGVGLDKMTLIHAAEELAGRKPFVRWANGEDGAPTCVATGGCSDGFNHLEPALSRYAKAHRVGESLWRAYPVGDTLGAAAEAITKHPAITRCSNPACERCRDALQGGPIW